MRNKVAFILTIVAMVVLLIAVNLVSYSEEEQKESELAPIRSTFHAGPTGTRALYDVMRESGFSVTRWRERPGRLLTEKQIKTFVVIGNTKLPFDEGDAEDLFSWVFFGGQLVVVDRNPPDRLVRQTGAWVFNSPPPDMGAVLETLQAPASITQNVNPVSPIQPTLLTGTVDKVLPSRLANALNFTAVKMSDVEDEEEEQQEGFPTPPPNIDAKEPPVNAPVVHLATGKGPLLLDYAYGHGRVIVLSDPYIFSNEGIRLEDNLQLAINLCASREGFTAFDEYHQGRGVTNNAIVAYFTGTPVLVIAAQALFLLALVLWTHGRRFARPLPLPNVDRRSSLEFVASMAEVQQQSRAYDLAIENIYSRTRRVLARYAGLDYNSPRSEIAQRVASRSNVDRQQLEVTMRRCEDAINGEPISERQSLQLVRRLREIESALGLRLRSRDAKRAGS